MPTVIYLDQNKWIRLLQQREGKVTDPEIERILNLIISSTEDESVIFPLAHGHLVETATSHNRNSRRDDLFKLMLKISNYWTLARANIVLREEVGAYFNRVVCGETRLGNLALGRGLLFMLGGDNWALSYTGNDNPEEVELRPKKKAQLEEAIRGREAFEISWEEALELFQKRDHEEELVEKMEKVRRQHEEKYSSNAQRRRTAFIRHYENEVLFDLSKLCLENKIPLKSLTVDLGEFYRRGEEAEEAIRFLQSFPANYTYVTLTVTRDLQKSRNIDKNDLNDIMSLSVAIPYCDVVVTEKFWTHEAKSNDLDEIYGTTIISKLAELKDVLGSNRKLD